jgi:tetratricopeptide (TPR) repeat protein
MKINFFTHHFWPLVIVLFFSCSQKSNYSTSNSKDKSTTSKLSERKEMELKRYFFDASKEKILKNSEKAMFLYQKCLEIDPKNDAAHYEMAQLYKAGRNIKESMSHINSSIKTNPEIKWYYLFKASLYEEQMKYAEAAKVYTTLLTKHESLEYYYLLATTQFFANDLKQSLETFSKIEEKYGKQEDITQQKSRIWLKLDNEDKAILELKDFLNEGNQSLKINQELANLLMKLNREDEALEIFKNIEKLDPGNPNISLNLANYYKEIGEKEKSFEQLKKAFINNRLDIDTKVQILLSYYTITEFSGDSSLKNQSEELCEIMKNTHPKEAKAYTVHGDFLIRDKKNEEALKLYEKAVELDPNRFQIWNQIIFINLDLKDFTSMARESEKAIEYFPNQPTLHYFRGMAYSQLSDHQKAIEAYDMANDLAVDNPPLKTQILAGLGDAYNSLKDFSSSDESYDSALAIDSNNTHVLNNYSYYLSVRGDKLNLAASMSKRTLTLEPGSSTFLDTYGWILYKQGKYEDAKNFIKQALDTGGDQSAVVTEHYGDILFKLGDKSGAIEYWNKAKEIGDGSEFLDMKVKDKILYE